MLHTGNVGIANNDPNTTFGVTGTAYVSGNTTVAANISGGNISTAGLITATGNITGSNLITGGLISVTGNVLGGNLITTGSVTAGAAGITATGNIRGGNLVSDGAITAVGNVNSNGSLFAQDQLSTQGNVTGNNITAGNIIATSVVNASSNISAAGNVTGSNLVTGGIVTATSNVRGGNLTTGGQVSATGNITTVGYFIGDGGFLSNTTPSTQLTSGTTTIAVSVPNGNIFATVNSVGNVLVISSTGISVTGNLTVNGAVTSTSASVASNTTITPTAGSTNQYNVTALAADASIAIPSGTPIDGQPLTIRILDDGTPRALTWTTTAGGYRVIGVTLPTTTVANKTVYIGCIYNSAAGFWDVVTVTQQL